jgi:hypothetical protein
MAPFQGLAMIILAMAILIAVLIEGYYQKKLMSEIPALEHLPHIDEMLGYIKNRFLTDKATLKREENSIKDAVSQYVGGLVPEVGILSSIYEGITGKEMNPFAAATFWQKYGDGIMGALQSADKKKTINTGVNNGNTEEPRFTAEQIADKVEAQVSALAPEVKAVLESRTKKAMEAKK